MRRGLALVGVCTLICALGYAGVASASAPRFTFAQQSVSSIVSVSPEVLVVSQGAGSGTYYLFTTGAGIGVYVSADGVNWKPVPGASTPRGAFADPSVIQMADGSYRMYLSEMSPGPTPCSGKRLRYATSSDLVTWSLQPGVLLDDLGCGVPDVVRDGESYHLYYVRGGPGVPHGIYLATSVDGLTWTPDAVIRTPRDRVDPSVAKVGDGRWLMMTSDMPGADSSPEFRQKLFVATSTDGVTWDFGSDQPVYAPPGVGAFDPNLNVMPDGTWKVWYARGSDASSAVVAIGILSQESPGPLEAPSKPNVTFANARVAVAWAYPAGAPAPEAFAVEVRKGTAWTAVKRLGGDATSATLSQAALGAKRGAKLTVRVVALRGDERAESLATSVKVPR